MLLSYEDALRSLIDAVPEPEVEERSLEMARNRILAEPVKADRDLPPFDRSVVDGYALRSIDLERGWQRLRVVGQLRAGQPADLEVGTAEAALIMTGARVPKGADAVQMFEEADYLGDNEVVIRKPVRKGANISVQGSQIRQGEVALVEGTLLRPHRLGVLAAFGCTRVPVYRSLRVAVVSTGDEVVAAHQQPRPDQIRDANGPMLQALCEDLGLDSRFYPVLPDREDRLVHFLGQTADRFDVVILSGGVSMGEHDYVHEVLRRSGADVVFHKSAVKPGKPLMVARRNTQLLFGLPGNPVSAFVTFQLFVAAAVRKRMGHSQWHLPRVEGRLERPVRQKPGRLFFKAARTRWREGGFLVEPIDTEGSSDLTAFAAANSLAAIAADVAEAEAGTRVPVLLLSNGLEEDGRS